MLKYYLKADLVSYMDLWTVEYWSSEVEEQMQLQHMEQVKKEPQHEISNNLTF